MKKAILAILCSVAALCRIHAGDIGVDSTNGTAGLVSGFGGLTLGWEFQVTNSSGIVVDGLGFWDNQSDGFDFGQTFPVGIWDSGTGTLLRSTVVTSSSKLKASLDSAGGWRVNAVSPLFLPPGFYRVGVLMPSSGGNLMIDFGATAIPGPGIGFVQYLRQIGSTNLAMPVIGPPTTDSSYFGPTFTYTFGPIPPVGTVVAPNSYESSAGTNGLNTLLRNTNSPRSYQMQFSAAALTGLPVGAIITELRFRLDTNANGVFPSNTVSWSQYLVTLAQAAKPVSSMSTNFLANMVSPMFVKTGPFSLTSNTLNTSTSPHPFCTFVVFDTPYVYRGGDLVMLFRHSGSDSPIAPLFLDALGTNTPGYGTDFRALSVNSFTASTGTVATVTIPEIVFYYSPIESIASDGINMVLGVTGGPPGGDYILMSSTNVMLPMGQWTPVVTNKFDGSGGFQYSQPLDGTIPSQMFRLAMPLQ